MSGIPGPSLLLAPSVRTEVVTTTTVTTTSYAPISLPPLPPPPVPSDPKQYPLLHARFPKSLQEFNIVFPDGAQATFRNAPPFPPPRSPMTARSEDANEMHNNASSREGDDGHYRPRSTYQPHVLEDDEVVGGTGWKMLRKDEIPKGEEVDIATAIERFNRKKRGSVSVSAAADGMDGVEMAYPHYKNHVLRTPNNARLRTNTELQMRGPSGSTTSAAAPPSPLPSPTGSPAPSFFFGPPEASPPPAPLNHHGVTSITVASSAPAASIATADQSTSNSAGPLQPDVQLTTLMTLPTLLTQYSALPSSLQSHVILTFLRQSPMPVLRSVNAILAPTLSRDFLTQLPAELVSIILSFLPGRALAQCTRVSKAWRAIIDSDPILWRELLRTTGSWFGGGAERAFARTLMNRREAKLQQQQQYSGSSSSSRPTAGLDLPHPYKVLFKSRQLTRTQWQQNPNPKRVTFAAHGSSVVTCLLFSHNRIISASDDHSIHVYNPLTGQLVKSLEGHGGGVWALAATKDTLVSGSTDRTVRIWDLERWRCTHVFGGHKSTVRCLAIVKPEMLDVEVGYTTAETAAGGADTSGSSVTGAPVPSYRKERWPKRTLIVTGSRDHTLRVWKLPKAHEPSYVFMPEEEGPDHVEVADHNPYHLRLLSGHGSAVRALAARGRTLVSGSYDHTVRVWDIITGVCKWVLSGHTQKVYSIVLDHARNQACSGSMDSSVRIWNLANGQCVHVLTGHTSLVGLLGLSNSYLVSAAADSTLRVWDPSTGDLLHTLAAHTGAITCFQHDEFKILSGSDGTLKMWDIRDGTNGRDLLTGITGVWQVVFDGRWCVAASNRHDATFLDVWDFGNDVVGDGDEEWVGEASVDGEDGDSELDEDVTEAFMESSSGIADMEQDEDEHEEPEHEDEDMTPAVRENPRAGDAAAEARATTIRASKRPLVSFGFQHPDTRTRQFAATVLRSGDVDFSPPPVSQLGPASASGSHSQQLHTQGLDHWSTSNPASLSGTPRDAVSSPSPIVPLPGETMNHPRMGGLLFGQSASGSASGSSSVASGSAPLNGGFFFSGNTGTGGAENSPSVHSPLSAPAVASVPSGSVTGGMGSLGVCIGEEVAETPTAASSSPPTVAVTPTGPSRSMVAPPPLGHWSSSEAGSAGASGSGFGPGSAAGPSRGLGLMGSHRPDETPSRPSRVRRK